MAVSSGLIHVSVSAKTERPECEAIAVMKSALLTADWQFHKPMGRESEAIVEGGRVRRLLIFLPRRRDTTDLRVVMTVEI